MLQSVEAERGTTLGPVPIQGHKVRPSVVDQDEISRLVQRVFRVPNAPRALLFSGIDRGDGCTAVCAAAAQNLATTGPGSICLVDANLRYPSIHKLFDLDNSVGLSEALLQSAPMQDFAQRIAGSNLWIVPSGAAISSAQGLTGSEVMRVRLAELRESFDHVLIDSPALNPSSDAMALGRLVDAMVLVLQSNATRRETARTVIDQIRGANVNLLGAVLNKRTFPIPQNLYARL
jgi:Mrp family chromosome partitioning ATPase